MLSRLLKLRRGFLAAALSLGGCSAEPLESMQAAIVNGERSVAADDFVVQLTSRPTNGVPQACSGTLVAPNIVLTALHCVAEFSGGDFGCSADGALLPGSDGAGSLGALVEPDQVDVRVGVYPGSLPDAHAVRLFGTGSNQICRNDLALLVLDRDLELPLAPLRLERSVELGELTRAIGYGASETATTEGRFARAGLRIIDRGEDAGGSSTGSAAPRTVVIGQGPCHGDSGGPLLSEETGATIGVYSLVTSASCTALGVRNVYTRIAPFAELVQSAFTFAAQMPILEAQAGDSAGAGGQADRGGAGEAGAATASVSTPSLGGSAGTGVSSRPGGSGSSHDASCACRAAPARPSRLLAFGALLGFAALLARRRRRGLHSIRE